MLTMVAWNRLGVVAIHLPARGGAYFDGPPAGISCGGYRHDELVH